MTGYGETKQIIQRGGKLYLTVQTRSVNHRFFNLQLSLPEMLSDKETQVEGMVRKHIQRGSINLSVRLESGNQGTTVPFNTALIKRYYRQLQNLKRWLKLKGDVSIDMLLGLPGVLEKSDFLTTDNTVIWPATERAINKALDKLVRMREREGRRLKKELVKILGHLIRLARQIEKHTPEVLANYRQMLKSRIKELTASESITVNNNFSQRLAQEVAFFVQRCDITEELHRLSSHCNEFQRTLNERTGNGKKLDFLAQELLREINTIASKSNNAQISHLSVTMKTEVDKLKEQIQNIE